MALQGLGFKVFKYNRSSIDRLNGLGFLDFDKRLISRGNLKCDRSSINLPVINMAWGE